MKTESKWGKVKLGSIAKNLDSKRKPLNDSERKQISKRQLYPYVGANNVMGYVDEYLFDEEIICIAEDGGSWGKGEKCVNYYNEKCWVNNHAHVLGFKGDADLKYLMRYLNYADLSSFITGSTRGKLTKSALESIPVTLPPLSTQKRIAEILDKADALRKKDQQLLKHYDELAQSLFIDMFGDPVRNEKRWQIRTLAAAAKNEKNAIVDGPFGSSVNDDDYCDDGIPVIRINNIREDGFYNGSYRLIKESKYNELIRSKVNYNDILIARVGHTIGKSCLFPHDFKAMLSTTGVCKVSINPDLFNIMFTAYQIAMPSYKSYIKGQVQGAGQPYLNLTMIKNFKLVSPPMELQDYFAKQIQNIEQQKGKVKAQMQESEHLFQALLQQAFDGGLN